MATAVSVEGLSKRYLIKHQSNKEPYATLRDVIAQSAKSLARKLVHPTSATPPGAHTEEFWALNDVSFEIEQGDRVGIIGRNGAGKSTLLKLLSRITEPTKGKIRIRGRVASLLEVGTGFNPELTGRENIFLNGSILGMTKVEIHRKFDAIVAFSEVEKFLDTPVKRYSSGMYVRLAFAIAAHLEPEILIVDEVLAVGDTEFQKKCMGKMEEVGQEGRTLLFVSHNMGAVNQLCHNAILLREGKLVRMGLANDVVKEYLKGTRSGELAFDSRCMDGTLVQVVKFKDVSINNVRGAEVQISPASEIRIRVEGTSTEEVPAFRTTFSISREGVRLLTMHDVELPTLLPRGEFVSEVAIPSYLLRPGEYTVSLGGYRDGASDWLFGRDVLAFTVMEEWSEEFEFANFGMVNVPFRGRREVLSQARY